MRDILFRGKTDKGKWVKGVPFFEEERCYIIEELFICDEYDCTGAVNSMVIPETVGQYTGFTDKNGKKIFEGDIVKHYHDKQFPKSYSKGVIFFDEEYLRWKRTSENVNVCIAPDCIYEVIGNIHDNPELLKGGE